MLSHNRQLNIAMQNASQLVSKKGSQGFSYKFDAKGGSCLKTGDLDCQIYKENCHIWLTDHSFCTYNMKFCQLLEKIWEQETMMN